MPKPLSILIVHEVDYLEKIVFEFQEFGEVWAKRGHQVTVVDFVENHSGFFRSPESRSGVLKAIKEGPGIRLVRPTRIGGKTLSRIISIFLYPLLFARLFREVHFDLVFLYSAPTNGLSLLRQARKAGVPVIFRSIDILHHMRERWTRFFVLWAERRVYRSVQRVSALTPALGRYAEEMGCKPKNVVLNLPAINPRVFFPKSQDTKDLEFRKKWGLGNDTDLIIYLGTFFQFSGLEFLADKVPEICGVLPQVEFVFVGGGPLRGLLKQRAEKLSGQLTVIDFRPFSEVPDFLRESTLALNPFRPGPITRDIVPSKIFQYLGCGVPTLSTNLPGTKEILPEGECGVVYSDLEDFPKAIINLFGTNREKLDDLRRNAINISRERFSQELQVESFEKLFYEVLKPQED